ncbi:hypothetical protein M413DRAFT_119570 [Hebeloma cylindrosporum]|uniref:Uncharacterized protein n=1 Tax=Hebeloma cylindrosporum TaxID=76867 RepID=A0A0C2YNB1_HEBCY|nr:hypothetical protein M413DRAFT_119570 [Hebeloma cylindrosporum h7]
MAGIPAPDVADYKRRKEIELFSRLVQYPNLHRTGPRSKSSVGLGRNSMTTFGTRPHGSQRAPGRQTIATGHVPGRYASTWRFSRCITPFHAGNPPGLSA